MSVLPSDTSQLICCANLLTGFYMRATLSFNELSSLRILVEILFTPANFLGLKCEIILIIYFFFFLEIKNKVTWRDLLNEQKPLSMSKVINGHGMVPKIHVLCGKIMFKVCLDQIWGHNVGSKFIQRFKKMPSFVKVFRIFW